jgi:hypothetical protein
MRNEPTKKSSVKASGTVRTSAAEPGQQSTWLKIPQVSRGMRWFLIIVVVPIAVLNLPRLFTSSYQYSGGLPAGSGTFGPSPEERDALLQQLAELEQREQFEKQQQKQQPKPQPANKPAGPVPVLNGDQLGMTTDEFQLKYPTQYKERNPGSLDGPRGRYAKSETMLMKPESARVKGPIPAKVLVYQFFNGNYGKLEAEIEGSDSGALIADLTAQMKSPPTEFDLKNTSEKAFGIDGSGRPQLRWENDRVRITLSPSTGDRYRFKVLDKVYAKPLIEMYTDMGSPPK